MPVSDPFFAIYGASGCGRGVMPLAREMLERAGVPPERLVFVDDSSARVEVNGHRIIGLDAFVSESAVEHYAVIAIADGATRERLALRLAKAGVKPWTVRARETVEMDQVVLGEGAVLSPFVTLTSNITIGKHFHANVYSYVEHDCVIGDFVTFAPAVRCNGNVVIEDHAYIGTGAILRQGKPGAPLVIGRGAVVGMGAVVTKSVPPGVTVVGNPARVLDR